MYEAATLRMLIPIYQTRVVTHLAWSMCLHYAKERDPMSVLNSVVLLQHSYSFAVRLTEATVCGLSEHPSF